MGQWYNSNNRNISSYKFNQFNILQQPSTASAVGFNSISRSCIQNTANHLGTKQRQQDKWKIHTIHHLGKISLEIEGSNILTSVKRLAAGNGLGDLLLFWIAFNINVTLVLQFQRRAPPHNDEELVQRSFFFGNFQFVSAFNFYQFQFEFISSI